MYTTLLTHIRRFIPLTQDDEDTLLLYLQYQEVSNKEFILKAGRVCDANYFVVKGCFRMYLNSDSGTDQIVQFGIANWWITDYTSLEARTPSLFTIQALENSAVIIMDKKDQD